MRRDSSGPEPVDCGGKVDDAIPQRIDLGELRRDYLDQESVVKRYPALQDFLDRGQGHFVGLCQVLANLHLSVVSTRRWISVALHPADDSNRLGGDRQCLSPAALEGAGEPCEDRQVGVKPNRVDATDAEGEE